MRGWIYEHNGDRLVEDDLTAAEWAAITTFVCQALPHREIEIDPWHCQICRNAIVVTAALKAGRDLPEAMALLAVLPAETTLRAFTRRTSTDMAATIEDLADDEFVAAVT